ncbi:MAG: LysM peptidoglycan-binding domain-containing protein [Bacteroidota bacterium]|nr:LysM peptidoglycan-binding domain-containing protein [Bacteroidota bacterium]
MRKQLFSFILSGFLLISLLSFGQNQNYPVTTIKGIEYYQYTVQSGDGLLSIGRKFELAPENISKANPELKDGLKIGQQILIPVPKKTAKKAVSKNKAVQEFIQHKVEKKQTLFSISRKYDVSEEDIIKYNPGIEKGLHEGIVLQIPKLLKENKKKEVDKSFDTKSKTSQVDPNGKKQKTVTHKVQPSETLFSISRRYNVDIPEIIQLNPGSDRKLVVGTELIIPSGVTSKSKEQKRESEIIGSKSPKEEIKATEKRNSTKSFYNKTIKIAYLLPFMLDQPKNDLNDERFLNFYEGSLLAINEAKQKGISLEVYTYDTERSEDKVNEILNIPELKTMDLIIGPAYSNMVPYVGNFSKENKINTLIPFTSKVPDIESNPYLFQFNPGQDLELEFLSDLISGKYKNTHIVFAEIQDISPLDDGKIRADVLQKKLNREHRSFSSIELTTSENVNFKKVLKKGEQNLIIFNTDKFSNVSPYISSLSSESALSDIVLYEQFSWRNQREKKFQSIYISPFITKFNQTAIYEFNLQFDHYFGKDVTSESPRYDLLGYDLSNYFISLIHRYGSKFGNKINSNNLVKGIQSEPLFERTSNESGFINQRVYLGVDNAQ